MDLKIIKKAFKKSEAIKSCKERLMFLTKGRGDTDILAEDLWKDFKKMLKRQIARSQKATEDQKDTEDKQDTEKKQDAEDKQDTEKKPEKYQDFVSRFLKKGKNLKEIGKLWKKQKNE